MRRAAFAVLVVGLALLGWAGCQSALSRRIDAHYRAIDAGTTGGHLGELAQAVHRKRAWGGAVDPQVLVYFRHLAVVGDPCERLFAAYALGPRPSDWSACSAP